MGMCDFCQDKGNFFPPDMIDEPIEEGPDKGKRKCHFCKLNTDTLVGSDGTVYRKLEVLADYKKFCDDVYLKPEIYVKFNKSLIDDSIAKNIEAKNKRKKKKN